MVGRYDKKGDVATRPARGIRFARNLDWNLLRAFYEVVQAQGVSKAARRTGRGQPTISMALKRLEDVVGVRLCHRGPSGFGLTREGEMVSRICDRLFTSVASVPGTLAHAIEEVRGRVRVQMISNLVNERLDRALETFHKDYENVEVYISISTWDVIKRNVLRNEVELGISTIGDRDPDLRYEPLFREVYRPYCGRSHPLYGRSVDNPADLASYGFVLTGGDEPDQLRQFRQRHHLGRKVAGLSEHLEEARRLATVGVGLCFLPEAFAERDVADGDLHPVLPPSGEPASDIFLLFDPKAPDHRLRDLLAEHIRAAFARS